MALAGRLVELAITSSKPTPMERNLLIVGSMSRTRCMLWLRMSFEIACGGEISVQGLVANSRLKMGGNALKRPRTLCWLYVQGTKDQINMSWVHSTLNGAEVRCGAATAKTRELNARFLLSRAIMSHQAEFGPRQ